MKILQTENLKKYYKTGENVVKAVDGVNLEVERGEYLAIVGKSGSGKSTLLHLIEGLEKPTEGEIYYSGKALSEKTQEQLTIFRRRNVGFVFQSYNLVPILNVYENIVLPLELDGEKIESEYEELAKKVIEICPNVILHSYMNVAKKIGVKRIHLPLRLMNENIAKEFETVGVSVHSADEAVLAEKMGATYVTAGHIFYGNTDITELNEDALSDFRRENLGFVFQDFNLLDTLTIEENIILAMSLHGKKKKEIDARTDEILKTLGISEIRNKFPGQVSGGQKQRCACARALVNDPKLILADEPTGALDSRSAQMLLDTLKKMNEVMGATILMVTHDAFTASYCQRILFLKDGEIFHELIRGQKSRREFLNEILDVLALTGGDSDYVK